MDNLLKEIIIGALLHDIGKLTIRAGEYDLNPPDADIFLPKKNGKYQYIHSYFSHKYVMDFLKDNRIGNLVYGHHIPYNKFGEFVGKESRPEEKIYIKIIKLADWLSSGERREKENPDEVGETPIYKQPLKSIFSLVKKEEEGSEEESKYYHPIVPIQEDLSKLYPVELEKSEGDFEKLWSGFQKESEAQIGPGVDVQKLWTDNFDKLLTKILSLLEKYTLFVPSASYKDKPEVSLFHHLKTTSAIATCLYKLYENGKLAESKIDKILSEIYEHRENSNNISKENDFILLSGDISGIQDFIYSVTTEKALKGLRGRSYYLQLLTDAITRYIVNECEVSICNILFLAGGHFSILLPNTTGVKDKIENIKKEVTRKIYAFHGIGLGVTIGYTEFSYGDFLIEKDGNREICKFKKVLDVLHDKMSGEKKQKFNTLFDSNFFEPKNDGNLQEDICKVCSNEQINKDKEKCSMCESFEDLATKLKNSYYLTIKKVTINNESENRTWQTLLGKFGYYYDFKGINDEIDSNYIVYQINNVELNNFVSDGFICESVTENYNTLEEIANKSTGIKKYAALKIDLDNLSQLKPDPNTISRFSMFSYMLNLFFTVGVKYIVEKEYKDTAIVVYSGGDDLFILGAWSSIPKLALKINNCFKRFVQNTQITISGGIFIAPSRKFPVFYSAKQSSIELNKAKDKPDKNSISFLSKVIKWNELKSIEDVKDNILEFCKKEGEESSGRSLIGILSNTVCDVQKDKINTMTISRLLYALKRYAERYEKDDNIQLLAMKLRENFIIDYSLRENLAVAVQWADYLTRKEVKNE